MQRINPSLLAQANPFAEKLPSILKERAGKIIDKLMRAVFEARKVRKNHRIGPGRFGLSTYWKRVQRDMGSDVKPYQRVHYPRPDCGQYASPEAAARAMTRLARWMASNPAGSTPPRHIARNAALASRVAR